RRNTVPPPFRIPNSALHSSPVPRFIGEVYFCWRSSHGSDSGGSANGRTIECPGDGQRDDCRGLPAIIAARAGEWSACSTFAGRGRDAREREQFRWPHAAGGFLPGRYL